MNDLKTRIKGRIILLVLLFIIALLLSCVAKFIFWLFGGGIEFRPVFWATFPTLVILYAVWYVVYKFIFEVWINEFNDNVVKGFTDEVCIRKANEKSKIRPPLKIALQFAKNQRHWKGR